MVQRRTVAGQVDWPVNIPHRALQSVGERFEPAPISSIHDTTYDLHVGNLVIRLVATMDKVAVDDLTGTTRGTAEVSLSRHIAMYLMHTVFSCPYHRVAAFFSRDRTTVSHACRLIEDARDDAAFDQRLEVMENLLVSAKALHELASAGGGGR